MVIPTVLKVREVGTCSTQAAPPSPTTTTAAVVAAAVPKSLPALSLLQVDRDKFETMHMLLDMPHSVIRHMAHTTTQKYARLKAQTMGNGEESEDEQLALEVWRRAEGDRSLRISCVWRGAVGCTTRRCLLSIEAGPPAIALQQAARLAEGYCAIAA